MKKHISLTVVLMLAGAGPCLAGSPAMDALDQLTDDSSGLHANYDGAAPDAAAVPVIQRSHADGAWAALRASLAAKAGAASSAGEIGGPRIGSQGGCDKTRRAFACIYPGESLGGLWLGMTVEQAISLLGWREPDEILDSVDRQDRYHLI